MSVYVRYRHVSMFVRCRRMSVVIWCRRVRFVFCAHAYCHAFLPRLTGPAADHGSEQLPLRSDTGHSKNLRLLQDSQVPTGRQNRDGELGV